MADEGNIQTQTELDPLLPSSESQIPKGVKTFGQIAAFATAVNFLIGSGVFSLPYAFYVAGIPLTLVTFGFFAFFLVLGAWWIIELVARTEGMKSFEEAKSQNPLNPPLKPTNHVDFRQHSYTAISYQFGGKKGNYFTQVIILAYSLGSLWGYVATVGSSVAMLIFEFFIKNEECNIYHDPSAKCQKTYYLSVVGYACIVIPLSLFAIAEQQVIQLILTAYRFIALSIMIITVMIAYIINGPMKHGSSSSSLALFTENPGNFFEPETTGLLGLLGVGSSGSNASNLWGFKWAGFGTMFPCAALALNLHWNIPDCIAPCRNKKHLRAVIASAQLIALVFYLIIGSLCALFFDPPDPLVTLNWSSYTGKDGGWGSGDPYWWATAIQLIIVFFPIINMINTFPLVAISLASNVAMLFPDTKDSGLIETHGKFFSAVFGKDPQSKHRRISITLCCIIPPLVLGILVGKLDVIFTIAGLFGFALEFVTPTVFHLKSTKYMSTTFAPGAEKTPYSGWYSSPVMVWIELVVGLTACAMAIAFTIINWTK